VAERWGRRAPAGPSKAEAERKRRPAARAARRLDGPHGARQRTGSDDRPRAPTRRSRTRSTRTSTPSRRGAATTKTGRPGSWFPLANGPVMARTVTDDRGPVTPGSGRAALPAALALERVTGIEPALSAWELYGAVALRPADSVTCGFFGGLSLSDRDYPRVLLVSGTQRHGWTRELRQARSGSNCLKPADFWDWLQRCAWPDIRPSEVVGVAACVAASGRQFFWAAELAISGQAPGWSVSLVRYLAARLRRSSTASGRAQSLP